MKMKNFRNEDGTYNVYDFTLEKWRVVDKDWFNGINLQTVKDAEVHFSGDGKNTLKIIHNNDAWTWYRNVHGSWGMPYKVV